VRVAALQRALAERGAAAALVTSMENVRYLTGHAVWTGRSPATFALVPAAAPAVLWVPPADEALARALSRVAVTAYRPDAGFDAAGRAIARALAGLPAAPRALAVEHDALTLRRLEALQRALPGWTFPDAGPHLAQLRLVKDAEEQGALRRAGALAAVAAAAVVAALPRGLSEGELRGAADLAVYAESRRRHPQVAVRTLTNVLSGEKLARLHAAAAGEVPAPGDPAVLVAHVSCDGYWADVARTFFVPDGTADGRAVRAVEVAAHAQQAAIAALGPGRTLREALGAAESVLAAEGLGGRHVYAMFRGLGLHYDEAPGPADLDVPLVEGMCVCAQVYLQLPAMIVGRADSVLVTARGPERLTEDAA
jgi:Xaa-Pro aminopeptidase